MRSRSGEGDMQEEKRKCSKCGLEKGAGDFYVGPGNWCKECRRSYVRGRRSTRRERGKQRLYPEQWPILLQHVTNKEALLLFDLLQSCGLRPTEALALRAESFDFSRGTVTVKNTDRGEERTLIMLVRADLLIALEERKGSIDIKPQIARKVFREAVAAGKSALEKVTEEYPNEEKPDTDGLSMASLRYTFGLRLYSIGAREPEFSALLRLRSREPVWPNFELMNELLKKSWEQQPRLWTPRETLVVYNKDGLKKCTRCSQEKPPEQFTPGVSRCLQCVNEVVQPYMEKRKKGEDGKRNKRKKAWYVYPDRAKWSPRERILYPEQWPRFWRAVKEYKFRMIFDLMQSCGLRAREALYIGPKDFDFDRGVLAVRTLKQVERPVHDVFVRPDILRRLRSIKVDTEGRYFDFEYPT